ncbi:carboxylesterase family protein [Bradyrhizobium sp.]|uniref:carboxylesterase family protein n=1 Tax=Bradyrhizobium sp. TaxID=376 RepID=UPI0025BCFA18|nr:carboxylesterase family protein [Bradyrhizobium sp.]
MTRYLVFLLLLMAIPNASVRGGLAVDDSTPSPSAPAPDPTRSCEQVSFTRNLKYGESELNALDVATGGSDQTSSPRPVLLFVTGESFTGENSSPDAADPMQDAAMCFAARNGMIGVRMNYRLAPANPWPSGAQDVAAATSWVHQNIDLFGGSRDEIVAIGYSVGAFHVASLLGHPEFQDSDSSIAAAVLVSGIYHASADAGAAEKSYFGADASQYDARSAFPGILNIQTPLLLAWSAVDPPRLVAEGEKLKQLLCNSATHCPHTTVLRDRANLASVFGLDPSGGSLAQPTLELVREIEARGLP